MSKHIYDVGDLVLFKPSVVYGDSLLKKLDGNVGIIKERRIPNNIYLVEWMNKDFQAIWISSGSLKLLWR
jgi:hypothetical protein